MEEISIDPRELSDRAARLRQMADEFGTRVADIVVELHRLGDYCGSDSYARPFKSIFLRKADWVLATAMETPKSIFDLATRLDTVSATLSGEDDRLARMFQRNAWGYDRGPIA